jgi:DNA repair protein RadD
LGANENSMNCGRVSICGSDVILNVMEGPFGLEISLKKLHGCQSEAYLAATKHFATANADRSVIIQLPTGTGKTALIATLPFTTPTRKVLVLTPNVKLARNMARELDIVGNAGDNVYKRLSILPDDALGKAEFYVLRLEGSADAGDIDEHHIIVSNYHQLQDIEKWFAKNRDAVDLIVIDEAHHQAAATYQEIIEFFPKAKIVGLTATPFRSDGKPIEGTFIYKYSFNQAYQRPNYSEFARRECGSRTNRVRIHGREQKDLWP